MTAVADRDDDRGRRCSESGSSRAGRCDHRGFACTILLRRSPSCVPSGREPVSCSGFSLAASLPSRAAGVRERRGQTRAAGVPSGARSVDVGGPRPVCRHDRPPGRVADPVAEPLRRVGSVQLIGGVVGSGVRLASDALGLPTPGRGRGVGAVALIGRRPVGGCPAGISPTAPGRDCRRGDVRHLSAPATDVRSVASCRPSRSPAIARRVVRAARSARRPATRR